MKERERLEEADSQINVRIYFFNSILPLLALAPPNQSM